MIFQLPAQIMLSFLTQASKKMFRISGCVKGGGSPSERLSKKGTGGAELPLGTAVLSASGQAGQGGLWWGRHPWWQLSTPCPQPCSVAGPHQHLTASHSKAQVVWAHMNTKTTSETNASLGEPTAFAQCSESNQTSYIHCYFRILPWMRFRYPAIPQKYFFPLNLQDF